MSREEYLELFGLTPDEIFTLEELRRMESIVKRNQTKKRSKNDTVDKLSHLRELRRLKYIREKQKR